MIMTFCFASFNSNANLILSLDPVNDTNVNDSFMVSLYATTQTPSDAFIAWSLDYTFDNSILSLTSLDINPAFTPFGGNPLSGQVPFNFPALPQPIIGINVLLATFNFTAIGSGDTLLSIFSPQSVNAGFSNMFGLPIQFNPVSTHISVNSTTSVPEPSTWLLLLISCALLLSRKLTAK